MSLAQTYFLAQLARQKLLQAARRADRDLRILAAHANLLDGLMAELAEAEDEQEDWFNQSVSYANTGSTTTTATKGVQVTERECPTSGFDFDSEDEEDEEYESDNISTSSSESGEDVVFVLDVHNRGSQTKSTFTRLFDDIDPRELDDNSDDESDYLNYTRENIQQPPELLHDPDDESEDESHPPSPKRDSFDYFAGSEAVDETVTRPSIQKELETVPSKDDEDDVPLLGFCFSPPPVFVG
ncbi:uncharacterized protein GIQ15_01755 [Arthroderma uncinatum]|uniref:uncharacterized protein n=1 Tax=Arthroderma uncinatum TaxID=74035 RepID=UPI00144AEEC0|nr:uncharacterized protein GIQ15_01755 [Arthroderma uncinatum]KAF3492238.1 hypothetical protein GIQ15_01755 [Arthroderma uncinatum]